MAKLSWNKFTTAYPSATCFVAAPVSSRWPKALFDGNGKRVPTPYGLLIEHLTKTLTGDWAATAHSKLVVVVKVQDPGDVAMLRKASGASSATSMAGCSVAYKMNYSDPSAGNLARSLGYKV